MLFLFALCIGAMSACGARPLENLGERTSGLLSESRVSSTVATTTTTSPIVEVVQPLHSTSNLAWLNDDSDVWGEGGPGQLEPQQVIDVIWKASNGTDAFVQVSPMEIASALPGIKFPRLVSSAVWHVSSQLVFSTTAGTLSSDYVAAFGLWTVEPYTEARATGQLAILWVAHRGRVPQAGGADGDAVCPEQLLVENVQACRPTFIGVIEGWWLEVIDGSSLLWNDGPYSYELFHRPGIGEDLAVQVAESMKPLRDVVATP